jgi:large conductance mechanosensitive channel
MNKQLKGFMNFVREQGVVGLAVGLAIGTQVGETVKTLVESFINPLVGFIVGSTDGLKEMRWDVVGKADSAWFSLGDRQLTIGVGEILSSLIVLFAVSGVIYYIVHGLKLDKADKKSDK